MNVKLSLLLIGLAMTLSLGLTSAPAQQNESIRLWPDGVPDEPAGIIAKKAGTETGDDGVIRIPYVDAPEIVRFPAPAEQACGTSMIVCPGGAYRKLAWNKEGTEIAAWLNTLGVDAVVLKYRVPRRNKEQPHPWPLQDLQRAIRIVRDSASRWKIDPNRVGVIGFSAGGHLAVMAASQSGQMTYQPRNESDQIDVHPNFLALIYPAYLGNAKKDPLNLDPLVKVNAETPPTFITITHDDSDRALFAALYYAQLRRHGVSGELHIYSKGGHGYGLRASDHAVSTWPARLEDWLRSEGWIN